MKFLIVLIILVGVAAPSLSQPAAQGAGGKELKPLPEVHLRDFDDKPVKADSLKASVYVFDFWATWCGPCLAEIPAWNQLQAKYGGQGLKVVGVTLASGDASEVKPFVAKRNMKYTVLMGDDDQTYDLNVIGFPTTYVVTGDFKVFSKYVGSSAQKAAKIEADVQEILKRKNSPAAQAASDH
jgi:cytochrome c biogenesis protein CcmG, thiol:disulfide interchange protein DsbE